MELISDIIIILYCFFILLGISLVLGITIYVSFKDHWYSDYNPYIKIAFGCQKNVGKDEACKFLRYMYGGKILHFADPIYEISKYSYNKADISYKKDRDFLRMIGMYFREKFGENVWTNVLENTLPSDNNVFVGDVRFKNEFEMLRKQNFFLVKIERPSLNNNDMHISENELMSEDIVWDYILKNDDSPSFYEELVNLYLTINDNKSD